MSKNKALFSTSLSGFKKSEVVDYIEEQNRKIKMEREASEYEINSLQSDINSLTEENDSLKERIVFLDETNEENEKLKIELDKASEKLAVYKEELDLLKDDVATQRDIIGSLQQKESELRSSLSQLESERDLFAAKAELYDEDKLNAGGVLERARTEADQILKDARSQAESILFNAKTEARIKSEAALKESEKSLADNIRKVKYLQKRKGELLSAFEKIKDAAGGFYENVASVILKDTEE